VVLAEWSDVLRTVRAGCLAIPSRCGARLPYLTAHDVSEIDSEVHAVLAELGGGAWSRFLRDYRYRPRFIHNRDRFPLTFLAGRSAAWARLRTQG
jgi:hypothetical protein